MFSNWLILSLVSTILIIPAWLAIPFFQNNFGIGSGTFLIYYFVGTVIFVALSLLPSMSELIPAGSAILLMIGSGIIFGGPVNLLLFRAIELAPNKGLPVAIAAMASVGVFVASLWLEKILPGYFPHATFNMYHLIGMLLAVAAVIMFSLAPNK